MHRRLAWWAVVVTTTRQLLALETKSMSAGVTLKELAKPKMIKSAVNAPRHANAEISTTFVK
jgi:hypothetical protein